MEQTQQIKLQAFALKIRMVALECLTTVGFGHLGGIMSVADAVAVLYGQELRIDPTRPDWPERDKLVCSKGHAGAALYAALACKGFFPRQWLATLNAPLTHLPSHCDRTKTPGIDMTTGSLGQGASLAVGMALGDRLQGRSNRVFLILGDGECNEGQVWEAMSFAAAKKLTNLVVLLDWNKRQLDGFTEKINDMGNLAEKFRAFGFETAEIDGNDVCQLSEALAHTRIEGDKPRCIAMHTVKGAGIAELEQMTMNHSVQLVDGRYERWTAQLQKELDALEGK